MPRPKKRGRGGKKNRKQEITPRPADGEWTNRNEALDMTNAAFESYYKTQNIVPAEEWEDLMQSLRQPLPSTFRVSTHKTTAASLNKIIKETFVPELEAATFEGDALPVPKSIPWFPGGFAWQVPLPRKLLRKSPEYKRFHQFLVYESEAGNIARQETVSMVPPLFLDVKPSHYVLDMCAAPGSKTAQLLESLQPLGPSDLAAQTTSLRDSLLVANDSDQRRAQLLVHTTARRTCPSLMVTSVDASIFPAIFTGGSDSATRQQVKFDRILADVPCSGDGTLRKNVGIWRTWSARDGVGLHSLQLRILQRAMTLLKDGNQTQSGDKARIVYSTCSLNPLENEAVVAAALSCNPNYELVDVSDHLPELKRRSGISSWRPPLVKGKDEPVYFDSYDDYVKSKQGPNSPEPDAGPDKLLPNTAEGEPADASEGNKKRPISRKNARAQERRMNGVAFETMWPPKNATELNLHRCMRFYPHLQDTGGFFVAVLQKRASNPADADVADVYKAAEMDEAPSTTMSAGATKRFPDAEEGACEFPSSKKARLLDETLAASETLPTAKIPAKRKPFSADAGGTYKENPFTFVDPVESGVHSNLENLGLQTHFPVSNLYVRNAAGVQIRSLYLVNDVVKSIMQNTEPARVRLISAGVKVLARSDLSRKSAPTTVVKDEIEGDSDDVVKHDESSAQQLRVTHEGLHAVLPFLIRDRMLKGDAPSLRTLLRAYYPLCTDFEEPFRSVIKATAIGSHVICFKPGWYGKSQLVHELYLPLWKSGASVSMMVDKQTKSALSLQLFAEDVTAAATKNAQSRDETKVENEDAEMDSVESRSTSPQVEEAEE